MAHQLHTNLSDEELLQAYRRSGDNEWLGYLLQRYTALLFGVGMKYLKDRTQAEDAVQQVFLKVLTHHHRQEILNFKGWLYVLTRNHCLQLLRDTPYFTGEEALENTPADEQDMEEPGKHEYSLQEINEALEALNEEQRNSIKLFYLNKCSYAQIIAQTGYTFMQVKSYIQNAKRNLKTILLKKTTTRQ